MWERVNETAFEPHAAITTGLGSSLGTHTHIHKHTYTHTYTHQTHTEFSSKISYPFLFFFFFLSFFSFSFPLTFTVHTTYPPYLSPCLFQRKCCCYRLNSAYLIFFNALCSLASSFLPRSTAANMPFPVISSGPSPRITPATSSRPALPVVSSSPRIP